MLTASEPQASAEEAKKPEISPPVAISGPARIVRALLALAGVILAIALIRVFLRSLLDL
jgi:hypothetical protein